VKWLEDELELNALHNPGSRQGSGNEKAALSQRAALSAALGGRVDVTAMTTISGGLHLLYNSLILSIGIVKTFSFIDRCCIPCQAKRTLYLFSTPFHVLHIAVGNNSL